MINFNRIILLFFVVNICLSCTKTLHLSNTAPSTYRIDTLFTIEEDPAITKMIAPYKNKLDKEMNEVVGHCANDLYKGLPECSLGNWLADMMHYQSEEYLGEEIDFAVYNYGGIRLGSLAAGPVTVGKIFELMPFENKLAVVYADAATVELLLNRMAEYGGWPVSKSLNFEIRNGAPENVKIKGKPISPKKIYKIALSDYVANGGDSCFFFADKEKKELDETVRDGILDYVKYLTSKNKKIDAKIEGRVINHDPPPEDGKH